ncbi:MAG TPA: tetratricopeptide repeat protein [Pyrinomonadaceae bacterium]|nr:tetratricopeptide repeat protein [Pyrinomonadaceae bacterium]
MFNRSWMFRAVTAAVLVTVISMSSLSVAAQDLVAVSSLSGSSSVFVFRSGSRGSKPRPVAKPTRTKTQRLASAVKIKKQYETIAKNTTKVNRAKIIDPNKLGPKGGRDLPPVQASKLFAGVGEYYVDKAEYEQAFEFFREAIRLDPKNVMANTGYSEALALNGNALLVADKGEQAKGYFLEAIKFDPKNAAAYFGLGELYSGTDNQAEAISSYEKSLATDKGLTEIYVPLGILYYQSGEIAKADDLLTKALLTSGDSAETQFFLGLVRAAQNRNDEALAAFQKAKTIDPTYADAYFNTAEVLVRLKRTADAIPEYKQAISLRPNYLDAIAGLGQAYLDLGNYPDAIIQLKAAEKLKSDNWEVLLSLGDAFRMSGEFNNAIPRYTNALLFYTKQPNFSKEIAADLNSKLGFSLGKQCEANTARFVSCERPTNLWQGAVTAMEKAVELSGGNAIDQANLGWAYYNYARLDIDANNKAGADAKLVLAKEALQKAVAGNPIVADGALQNLGGVLIDQGDFAGAINALKQVVDTHPDWTFSRYALGTAYFKVNDFDNSAKWFRAVLEREPKYVGALTSLGYAEIKRKNGKEVKRIVDVLKTLSPGDAIKLENAMKAARL